MSKFIFTKAENYNKSYAFCMLLVLAISAVRFQRTALKRTPSYLNWIFSSKMHGPWDDFLVEKDPSLIFSLMETLGESSLVLHQRTADKRDYFPSLSN